METFTSCLDCIHYESETLCESCIHSRGDTECFEPKEATPVEVSIPNKTETAINAIFAALNAYTTEKAVMLGAQYVVQQYLANVEMIRTVMADAGITDPAVLNILGELKAFFLHKAAERSSVLEGGHSIT